MRFRGRVALCLLLVFGNVWPLLAAKKSASLHLSGYEGVPVYYGGLNKMLMRASINGHPALLIIDTGASRSILEATRAHALGVRAVGPGSPYGRVTFLNGQPFRVGYIDSLKAGNMDFGGGSIALFGSESKASLSTRADLASLNVTGVLGADILTRHKAVINCRTRYIFFKTDQTRRLQLAQFALSQRFTKIPMRQEANRAFTVPCSINGHRSRLLVDTGAFITTFNHAAAKSLGIPLSPTEAASRFSDGVSRRISLGKFSQLLIGDFRVAPQRLGVTVLPDFALRHGTSQVDGILGMELLAFNNAIIDFDSMNLFLK